MNIAMQWAEALGVDNSQYSLVQRAAAEFMEDAWLRQSRVNGTGSAVYGTREYFALREQAMQAQVEALRKLSPYLTVEQQAKLKNLPVREHLFVKIPEDK